MPKHRLSRRELAIFAGAVARQERMMEPLAEMLCYRTGTLRPTDAASIRAVARKHGVPASSLHRNVQAAEQRIVRAFRFGSRVNRDSS